MTFLDYCSVLMDRYRNCYKDAAVCVVSRVYHCIS